MKKIKSRLKNFFTTNILLKIGSLVLAFLCWAAIANENDQVLTRVVNVPIEYMFEDSLEEDYQLAVLEAPETIAINVQVRRSSLDRVTADDFTATADLTQNLGGSGDFPSERLVYVEVDYASEASKSIYVAMDYPKSGPYVEVTMDKYIEKTFQVQKEVTAGEGLPQEYVLSDDQIQLNPSVVTISGPESEFSNVASVKVVEALEMTTEDQVVTKTVDLNMYDNTNTRISRESKPLLKMSAETAELTATFLNVGTPTVKLESVNGTPAEGYKVTKVEIEPLTVTIGGMKSVVSETSEILISSDVLSVEGQRQDVTVEVDLNDYLPDGVELLGDSSMAVITVKIEQLKDRVMTFNTSALDITGEDPDYDYTVNPSTISIRINGFESELDDLSQSSIHASIDVEGLEPGTHTVPVLIEEIVGYTIKNQDSLTVRVTVRAKNAEEETTASSSSGDGAEEEESQTQPSETQEETSPSGPAGENPEGTEGPSEPAAEGEN